MKSKPTYLTAAEFASVEINLAVKRLKRAIKYAKMHAKEQTDTRDRMYAEAAVKDIATASELAEQAGSVILPTGI